MCELTLACVNSARKNSAVTLLSAMINSEKNPHGFGFSDGTTVWKTDETPRDMSDLGILISSYIVTDVPIISHVRLASKGISLNVENNHPFETEHFIGAHNGTLFLTNEESNISYADNNASRGSDSQRFFNMLEDEYVSNGEDFLAAIRTVMGKHKGKFAFLIFEKKTTKYYVVRGKTADLYISDCFVTKGKKDRYIGFIVNTDKSDLEKLIDVLPNIWGLLGEKGLFSFSRPEELKKETIYTLRYSKLVELGELKENPIYVPSQTQTPRAPYSTNWDNSSATKKNKALTADFIINAVVEFQNRHFLSPHDMDLIFWNTLGLAAGEINEEALLYFTKLVMPALNRNKEIRKLIKAEQIKTVPYYFYTPEPGGFGLQFPWMLNTVEELKIALSKYAEKIRKDREQAKKKVGTEVVLVQ